MKIKFCLFVLYILCCNKVSLAQQKSNILFIAVDDFKPIAGCYGNTQIKTPNIDRLAKMGTVFMSNYCQQAVCGPTRASLMTGKRPDYTKIWDLKTQMRDMNPNIITLPQYLISQGYATSGVGKIFHPSSALKRVDPVSWSVPYILEPVSDYANGLGKPGNNQYQSSVTKALFDKKVVKPKNEDTDDENPTSTKGPSFENIDVPDHAYTDGVDALLAKKQLIKFSKSKQSYFMAVGFHKPHLPFVAPKKYWDLYKAEDMPLAIFQDHSKNGVEIAYHRSGELRNYIDIPEFATYNEEGGLHVNIEKNKQKALIHGYYAAVSFMDAQVGVLLKTLDSLGTLNNTIIVLWGDHGWHLGDHDLWEKHTNFEQATRAPLIIAAPGIKPGKTSSLSEHVDIFPTICDLAGTSVPSFLDGKSLKPLMVNNKAKVKEFSVSQYPRKLKKEEQKRLGYTTNKLMGYALRTEKYRYVLWMNDYTSKEPFSNKKVYASELYDYDKDPLEKENVVNDKKYSAIKKELNEKMIVFFKAQTLN